LDKGALSVGGGNNDITASTSSFLSIWNTGDSYDVINGSDYTVAIHRSKVHLYGDGVTCWLDGSPDNIVDIHSSSQDRSFFHGNNATIICDDAYITMQGDNNKFVIGGVGDINNINIIGNSEILHFDSIAGTTSIVGFRSSDVLEFSARDFSDWQSLISHTSQVGSDTLISITSVGSVILCNTNLNDIISSNVKIF
jgi:hypothetical protein